MITACKNGFMLLLWGSWYLISIKNTAWWWKLKGTFITNSLYRTVFAHLYGYFTKGKKKMKCPNYSCWWDGSSITCVNTFGVKVFKVRISCGTKQTLCSKKKGCWFIWQDVQMYLTVFSSLWTQEGCFLPLSTTTAQKRETMRMKTVGLISISKMMIGVKYFWGPSPIYGTCPLWGTPPLWGPCPLWGPLAIHGTCTFKTLIPLWNPFSLRT